MSLAITDRVSQDKVARITGGFYLGFILASVLADRLGHIGLGDPYQVYQSILTNTGMFRLGLVVALFSAFLFLVTAWGLYLLLRPIDENVALLFLLLNTVGVAIQCASMLPLIAALLLGSGAGQMTASSPAQLEELVYLSINVYKTGFVTAQLFFGTWLFPLGYLVYISNILPSFLGVLLLLDGVAVMIWFLQALLLPEARAISAPGLVVSFVAEVGLSLWLIIKGARGAGIGPGVPANPSHSA